MTIWQIRRVFFFFGCCTNDPSIKLTKSLWSSVTELNTESFLETNRKVVHCTDLTWAWRALWDCWCWRDCETSSWSAGWSSLVSLWLRSQVGSWTRWKVSHWGRRRGPVAETANQRTARLCERSHLQLLSPAWSPVPLLSLRWFLLELRACPGGRSHPARGWTTRGRSLQDPGRLCRPDLRRGKNPGTNEIPGCCSSLHPASWSPTRRFCLDKLRPWRPRRGSGQQWGLTLLQRRSSLCSDPARW